MFVATVYEPDDADTELVRKDYGYNYQKLIYDIGGRVHNECRDEREQYDRPFGFEHLAWLERPYAVDNDEYKWQLEHDGGADHVSGDE